MKKKDNMIKNRVKIEKKIEKELLKTKKLKKSISITIDDDLDDILENISKQHQISKSGIISTLISYYYGSGEKIRFRVGKKKPE